MNKVLIVIDMQNDFIDGALGTKEAQRIVPGVADKIHGFDGDLMLTQDTHDAVTYADTQEGRLLPVIHCVRDSVGWMLHPDIVKAVSEKPGKLIYLIKSAFASQDIAPLAAEYDEIHVCGLCTDICIISNAILLKSFHPEKPVYVDAACCAGTTPEMHQCALDVMSSCQIIVVR